MYFFAYCNLMDKNRFIKMGFKENDVETISYVCLPKHIFKYREILNSRHSTGFPNVEDRPNSTVNGILYNIKDYVYEKLVKKRCKPSKNDKKYKYLIKDVEVFDYDNCNNVYNAKTFVIHPLRLGDEVVPYIPALNHIIKTVLNIPNKSSYHIKRITYLTRY